MDLLRERGVEYETRDVTFEENLEEMQQRSGGKSFVPQIFLGDQYLGGYQEFMVKDAMGEIDRLLGIEHPKPQAPAGQLWDVIIIGGGPAGLTAAVYAARKGLTTLLLTDQLGGQPMLTWGVENYMGYQFISGAELMEKFEEQARHFRIDIETGQKVSKVELGIGAKTAHTVAGGQFKGRALVIASGKRSRLLGVPGEKEFASCGVSYCATCDGPVFAGQPVMVAGGGNSAVQAALGLAGTSPEVHLVSLTALTGDDVLIEKVNARDNIIQHINFHPVEIKGRGCVESVMIEPAGGGGREEVPVKGVFIEIGLVPNTGFVGEALELNEKGEILVDPDCRTGVPGVFAAGDVTQVRDKQIVVAAGEGAKAALSAHEYLLGLK